MEHDRLLATKRQNDLERSRRYKEESKDRLRKICVTKIKTTMIGALESIERRLEQYWLGDKPTNEGLLLKKMYEELRNEILDKGNNQIRNLDAEFEQYDVEWKRYTLQLPVKAFPGG